MVRISIHSRFIALTAALGLALTAGVRAQSADPAWLDRLSEQLAVEKECQVEYFLAVKEGQLAGRPTFEARAQCTDGRQFDGALTEPAKEFNLSECGTRIC
ncbi:hypothetical protein DFR52_102166 [Hoeflea marina]|uniref:Uncharacterized protein n=1 Tax=Hoeflea marina TaxID=274592 RepID=A0A317PRJ6_9HYPH|nr:hypothetical protein [Hoeflea marina]PWW01504.1 hypothetical protein DFR52_102166 [Hoeflea marina]